MEYSVMLESATYDLTPQHNIAHDSYIGGDTILLVVITLVQWMILVSIVRDRIKHPNKYRA